MWQRGQEHRVVDQSVGTLTEYEKTRLCKYFATGRCAHEEQCRYAHGIGEVRQPPDFFRTRLCVNFLRFGYCRAGGACSFAHRPEDLRSPSAARYDNEAVVQAIATLQAEVEVLTAHISSLMSPPIAALRGQTPQPLGRPAGGACHRDAAFDGGGVKRQPARQSFQDPAAKDCVAADQSTPPPHGESPALGPWDVHGLQKLQGAFGVVGAPLILKNTFLEVPEPAEDMPKPRRSRSLPAGVRLAAPSKAMGSSAAT